MFYKLLRKFWLFFFCCFLGGCAVAEYDLGQLQQNYSQVAKNYQRYIQNAPDSKQEALKIARFFYSFHDYPKVISIVGDYNSLEAKVLLAKSYARLKQGNYAIEIFNQLDKIGEDSLKDPEYYFLYGRVLEEKNLFPQAIKQYKRVKGKLASVASDKIKKIKGVISEPLPTAVTDFPQQARRFLEKSKNAAAVIYLADETIDIKQDNSSVYTLHVLEQVISDRGKELAEIEIGYDSTYERVELVFARSISPEGKIAVAGQENIRDVSRYLNFPLYSNARAFIVSTPAVDVGSFIEYKVKIYSSKLINEDDFSLIYRLRDKYPIFKANFRITIPQGHYFNYKLVNTNYAGKHSLTPEKKSKDGKVTYHWQISKIEPIVPEYKMPPNAYVNPAVKISSFNSWQEIYRWWHELVDDKFRVDKKMKQFVATKIKEATSNRERAKILYEFCARNIRYVAVEYGEGGHEPHFAREVFYNRYGDCKDQVVLLTALLREAGLEAYPALISTRGRYPTERDFPSTNFNHVICAYRDDSGELVFMDPTAETTSFGQLPLADQGQLVIVFYDKSWQLVKTPTLKNNKTIYRMNLTIGDDETTYFNRTVTTDGFFTAGHRSYLKHTHPSKIKEDIQSKMVKISPFAKLLDYTLENKDSLDQAPLLKYSFESEKFLKAVQNLRIIPQLTDLQFNHEIIAKQKREFPVDFRSEFTRTFSATIQLPQHLKIKYLPDSVTVDNRWFIFNSQYQAKDNEILVNKNFEVKQRFVRQQNYSQFKESFKNVLYFLGQEIILESKSD
jgi:tetratricopeptide (TPR) repeat protein